MYKLCLIFTLCFSINATVNAQTQADTDTITSRFRSSFLSGTPTNDTIIRAYLDSLQPNGSWNDVDYANQGAVTWLPVTHLQRLLAICKSYNTSSSVYYYNDNTKAKIYSAFNYWNVRKPTSTNWYNIDIIAPTDYGQSLLLMKTGDANGFSQDTLNALADAGINYYNVIAAQYAPTSEIVQASNQTLLLEASIYKGCIKDSTSELKMNFDTIFSNINIASGLGLGMKIDNSYYFHGSQLYNWGYGTGFLNGVSSMDYFARNTAFATTTATIDSLISYILDGQQWMEQGNICDYSALGRDLARQGELSVGSNLRTSCLIYLINLNTGFRTKELNNYYKYAKGGNVSFQYPGNKQFWKSDYMVQHGSNFLLSVKTPSKRTTGSETLNQENLKGKYLPWGSTTIMITGTEYQNAFPVWDWTRVPGTTTQNTPNPTFSKLPTGIYTPTNSFAGGVSNGVYGLEAYDFTFDTVSGKKAYFFTPTAMYCLGAGIASKKAGGPILTSVNQCISKGTITIDSAGNQSAFSGTQHAYTNLNWVYHNSVGYLFPSQGNITVANQSQSGSWVSIDAAQSATPLTYNIFSAWFNHGTQPTNGSYEYIVVPYKSVSQFSTWAGSNQLRKLINTSTIQAFADDSANVYAVAFYKAGSILLDTATSFSIKTNKPSLLLIQKQSNGYSISVADPTQLLDTVTVTTSVSLSGTNAVVNADSTTTINFKLPKGDTAGKTISYFYTIVKPLPIQFVDIKATLIDKNNIAVSWDVSDEIGIAKYEVQKSTDGKAFNVIGEVAAKNTVTSYQFIDNNVSSINFYRIKAISESGAINYSNVAKLTTNNSPLTTIYPNPLVYKTLNVQLGNAVAGKYSVSVYNSIGQKVAEQTISHAGGSGTYALNIDNAFAKGIYEVVIQEEGSKLVVYQTKLSVLK